MEEQPIPRAGSDAERRAHLRLARRLRDGGREVAVETHWVRPRGELAHALHAGVGVAASVVAVSAPAVGLGLALLALLSLLLDLSGRLFLLRRLTPERATENVLAADPRGTAAPPLRLLLVAAADAPRGGLGRRLERLRVGPPYLWMALALLVVAGCAGARLAGDDGETAIGIVQLVPTLVLLVALGLQVDAALADPLPVDERPAEALVDAVAALDAAPPRNVAVEAVVAGAGEAQALGFLAHLRRHRLTRERERIAVVELTGAEGPPRWLASEGVLLPLRYHPRLVSLTAAAADEERALDSRQAPSGRRLGAALRARQRRLPAIRVTAGDPPSAVALVLALVELLDADLPG